MMAQNGHWPTVILAGTFGQTVPARRQWRVGDFVAAITESPDEAAIDLRMGLRGIGGRMPRAEDFAGLLTSAGNRDYWSDYVA